MKITEIQIHFFATLWFDAFTVRVYGHILVRILIISKLFIPLKALIKTNLLVQKLSPYENVLTSYNQIYPRFCLFFVPRVHNIYINIYIMNSCFVHVLQL